MSELTHIFLCAVLKSLEIALQAYFSIKDTLAISECHNVTRSVVLSDGPQRLPAINKRTLCSQPRFLIEFEIQIPLAGLDLFNYNIKIDHRKSKFSQKLSKSSSKLFYPASIPCLHI